MTELPIFEVIQSDLSPYRKGNIGIDYVHRFESGNPGPHVLINALTHGNEICGMVAAKHLLDTAVRPKIGTLTVSFANVEAYNAFEPENPFENRQLVHNLNRVWTSTLLDSMENSPELRRARELRPVVGGADHILDIHSTRADIAPFWVYPPFERNSQVALAIGRALLHLEMPTRLGPPGAVALTHYAHHGERSNGGAAVVIECGQHFRRSSADLATAVALDFLAHFGLIDSDSNVRPSSTQRRFELLETHMVKADNFAFTRPLFGFEIFSKGELIAINGTEEIHSPCDECIIFMPTRQPIVGREAVYLTRSIC